MGCGAGWFMSENLFWGNWPLPFFLGSWMAISLLLGWKKLVQPQFRLHYGLATLSGLLLGKAFVYFSPLALVGFAPMIYIGFQFLHQKEYRWKELFFVSYHGFMVWNIVATYWVANAALVPGLVAFGLNSLFMCVPWILAIRLSTRQFSLFPLAFLVFWLLFEWGHHQWEISWPWLTLGNSMAFFPKWVQWYEYTGCFGGSLWVLVSNFLVYGSWLGLQSKAYKCSVAWLAWFLLPVIMSYAIYNQYQENGDPVQVSIVQPNYEPHYEKFSVDPRNQMDRFIQLSKDITTDSTEYLLWPETSFEYLEIGQFINDWRIQRMQEFLESYKACCIVTGLGTIKPLSAKDPHTDATRKNRRSNQPEFFEVQNSATQVCLRAEDFPIYVKSKLVPGVETFPYRQYLPFLKPIIDQLGGSIYGLGKQTYRDVFTHQGNKVAPVICYESIYGDYLGDYIRNGAQAIFIMTNDGWWDLSPGHVQHLKFGALRAIEFRKPIARSANTGISCFINARGEILQASTYGQSIAIRGTMLFNDQSTFYLKHGDYLIRCCLYLTILVGALFIRSIWPIRFSKNQLP